MRTDKKTIQKKSLPAPALRGHIWVDGLEGTFLGYARIVLLETIQEHGSITKAAKAMKISYRHAWVLVDSMNKQAKSPLVTAATGGTGGGGARVTEEGERMIALFWKFYKDFQVFLKQEEKKLKTALKPRRKYE